MGMSDAKILQYNRHADFPAFNLLPSVLNSQTIFGPAYKTRQMMGEALASCISAHGFANTATIKPSGTGNIIEIDIINVWDITITGVKVVPVGPVGDEYFSPGWFVLEFDPVLLRPNEVRKHKHRFQLIGHVFPEETEVEIEVFDVRTNRLRWIRDELFAPLPFTTLSEQFEIAERILCQERKP